MKNSCYTCDARPAEVKLGHAPVCAICYEYYRSDEPTSAEHLSLYSAQTSEEDRLRRQLVLVTKQRNTYLDFISERGLLEALYEAGHE